MKNWAAVAIFSLNTSVLVAADKQNPQWEKISDENGIVVFRKTVDDSEVISFRAETTFNATPQQVIDVVKDNTHAHEWIPLVRTRSVVRWIDQNSRIEYTDVRMPWPLTDRYFVAYSYAEVLKDGRIKMSTKSVDNPDAEHKEAGKILGFLHTSDAYLTSLDGGKRTHMTIEINSDPKGMIPKWLVNLAQKDWPRDFFAGLNSRLSRVVGH